MIGMFQIQRRAPGSSIWRVLFWWSVVVRLLSWGLVIVYRLRHHGAEHIPKTGPILFVANHQSNLDPPIIGGLAIDRPFKSIAKDTLFSSGILAFLMRGFGVISIRRGESDTAAIRSAIAELKAGGSVMLFPEGMRTQDGTIGEFQRGVWMLIRRGDAMVVPIGIEGAFDVWPTGSRPKFRGWIETAAGKPIPSKQLVDLGEKEGLELLKSKIESLRLMCRENIDRRSSK
jgi:1-acyl-sn-glycerol-3-phosphate acyltransferase|tara:strand:- start:4981 stop:5670 length:690 start_codon:yes stop_codon:yes gene_type:complete